MWGTFNWNDYICKSNYEINSALGKLNAKILKNQICERVKKYNSLKYLSNTLTDQEVSKIMMDLFFEVGVYNSGNISDAFLDNKLLPTNIIDRYSKELIELID